MAGARDDAEPDDAALLAAHAAGLSGAFEQLVRRHEKRLWAVALATCRDPEDASDALQDALVKIHRSAGSFRGESAVTTWLHRIVVNAGRDVLRRRAARPTVALSHQPDPAAPRGPAASAGAGVDAAGADVAGVVVADVLVHQALDQLPPQQRAAIVLVDLLGVSVAESAQLLAVAEGTIKSRCARGRARLAVLLGVLDPTGPSPDLDTPESDAADPDGTVAEPASSQSPTTGRGSEPPEPRLPTKQQASHQRRSTVHDKTADETQGGAG